MAKRLFPVTRVAKGLTAHLDADGETAGLTLEKARALLLPQLSEYDATSHETPLVAAAGYGFKPEGFFESSHKTQGKNPQSILNIGYFSE